MKYFLYLQKEMPRRKDRKGKCKIKIVPGPTGPAGPAGLPAVALTKRVLKVQLEGGLPAPNLIEGFNYEAAVEPPDWPVPGDFIFFRAEVLDTPGYAMGESFSVVASLVYGNTVPVSQNKLVIAHYRNDVLLAYHSAVSEIVGTEDYLIAQSVQDAAVGDFFYVAISPDTTDLLNFNHNLASLQTIPIERSFNIPGDLPISVTGANVAGNYIAHVTSAVNVVAVIQGAGGGGGAGGASSNGGPGFFTLGRGGAGGNGAPLVGPPEKALTTGDVIVWTIGAGGAGGISGDGQDGVCSTIKFPGEAIIVAPGGRGGQSGDNGGSSKTPVTPSIDFEAGCTGGGGGAPLVDGVPGTPGTAAPSLQDIPFCTGEDGGSNPRSGGGGGTATTGPPSPPVRSSGGDGGSTAGPNNRQGSGGGGGGGVPMGGAGGAGGPAESLAFNGSDSPVETPGGGGGGGGSPGIPPPAPPGPGPPIISTGGNGGRGSDGSINIFNAD